MSIPEVAAAMQEVLGPRAMELAVKTGFVQRASKMHGGVLHRRWSSVGWPSRTRACRI